MRMQKAMIVMIIAGLLFLEACNFLGNIFKAGIGVGVLVVVVVLVIIFFISRSSKRN
jgi:hypothetical protein